MAMSSGRIEAARPTLPAVEADRERSPSNVSERLHSLRLDTSERRPVRHRRRWAGGLAVVLLLAGIALAGPYVANWLPAQAIEVPAVRLATADSTTSELILSGVIVPRTRLSITPVVPGKIVALPIEEGMRVRKGDVLAQIEETNYRADFELAEAAMAQAKSRLAELQNGALPEEIAKARALCDQAQARYDLAAQDLDRAIELNRRKTLSASEFDVRRAAHAEAKANLARYQQELALLERGTRDEVLAAAEAEVRRAEAQRDKAKYYLEQTTVTSPIDGLVLEKKATVGDVSRSDYFLTSICTIGDVSTMEAEVDVQEREIGRIEVGQECRISPDALEGRTYAGRVTRIQPMVNRQRGVITVTAAISQPDEHLLADMNCRIEFLREPAAGGEHALRIPREAVVRDGNAAFVFAVERERADRRRVTVDDDGDPAMVALREGLSPGTVILLPGTRPLRDGQRVVPRFPSDASPP